ncbi:MAG: hypothetical protein A2747_03150 [Candidatus Yonathbacteria bacterium RIFCSPHIGHO2_01_FULL_44_41]|uniref:Transglutaminase-like domain-containing protein n=1 Tax=Candidatus Yonathbacteria bacterium RIFCSPHIGHO2_02_FULL_44_14 TaxID=1802724 RepID=A0A1G2S625_9BACT|nr:MAG: hypothetical protein A2747_03150 [Candidatus Yonathbacteria bacterium RIFCSPHIGHO2_01_FULL_44_41]OHA80506.1 MAG: hypothetical protein A3D51_00250 [Candidatus Yonathbacteria bacterium RIFCSPHIGHO2_02_FULL_44_14]OHA82205.1 MAG: hypothetical protein A3B06_01755 [Candidatus Yonathbacteria bacterium RIFCSPLOWO2_01_FULL_43_20]
MFGLSHEELSVFKRLSTPHKIQDFLDTLPVNLDKKGGTCFSPRMVLQKGKAHCIEGAFIAAVALWLHGEKPLLLDLKALSIDYDHVVALYKKNGYWGAISKTNHPVLRFRDPIYKSPREIALSYFHEYTLLKTGQKTLRSYSRPFSLKRFGVSWITSEKSLWDIAQALDESPHFPLVPKGHEKLIRPLSAIELRAGNLAEWDHVDPRT